MSIPPVIDILFVFFLSKAFIPVESEKFLLLLLFMAAGTTYTFCNYVQNRLLPQNQIVHTVALPENSLQRIMILVFVIV